MYATMKIVIAIAKEESSGNPILIQIGMMIPKIRMIVAIS